MPSYTDAVKQWQSIIGVTPDGIFGPQTREATIKWQKAHSLTPDGVVGPQTWKAAGLSGMPTISSSVTGIAPTATVSSSPSIFSKIKSLSWQTMLGIGVLGAIGYEIYNNKIRRKR